MVALVSLPGYKPNPLMDFSSINDAIDSRNQAAWKMAQMGEDTRRWNATNQLNQGRFDLQKAQDARAAELAPLQRDLVQAQAAAARREPTTNDMREFQFARQNGFQGDFMTFQAEKAKRAHPNRYGMTGSMVRMPDGSISVVQPGSNGDLRMSPLPQGATPLVGGTKVVGDELVQSSTGQPVRNVAPNLSAGEQAKTEGKKVGELITKIPAAQSAYETMVAKDKVASDVIDRTLPDLSGFTTGFFGSAAARIPGTKAHDIQNRLNTLKAQSGFAELQAMRDASPTGGALGQVSEQENRLLQSVWTAIEQSQSEKELRHNLGVLKDVIAGRQQRMRANIERLTQMQGQRTQVKPAANGAGPSGPDPLGLRR